MGKTSSDKFSDVPIRVRSWGVIVLILFVALLHPMLTLLFVGGLVGWGINEYFKVHQIKSSLTIRSVLVVTALFMYTGYVNNYFLFVVLSVLIVLILSCYVYFLVGNFLVAKKVMLGIVICVFSIGHLFFLRLIDIQDNYWFGLKLFVLILLLTELNDVFQYLTGKLFGKRKIVPKISPNKTLEGFVGGVFLTIVLSISIGPFTIPGYRLYVYALLGIAIGVLGFLGDVCLSAIKRDAGVKDFGNLIPGHGGLLDRVDSLAFVLPLFYLLLRFFR